MPAANLKGSFTRPAKTAPRMSELGMPMPAPAADRATPPAASVSPQPTSDCGGPNINPATGLSTDYLNHFTEAVMVLEMAGTVPECLDDLRAWRPKAYAEHFAGSRFSNRNAMIAAYERTDPALRRALDGSSELLNALLQRTRELVLVHAGTPEADATARRALERLRPVLARIAALINGTAAKATGGQEAQAAIDAMFAK
jgi:hypothetical protein